ncbi:MAG: DNA repair protein RecN [Thermomicrobiales bacterium]|nr:DNA repair protein RecN [Thermomicrobiales bacterium]
MLLELAIRDFAIIESVRIPFQPGFNALTGETGAGKSILIDGLGAVLGERVSSDMVRTGAKAAHIEATFDVARFGERTEAAETLAEMGVEPEDGTLILAREIAASGRSTARINGRAVTASMLARLGRLLVDIHGQSDHLSLLRPGEHLALLDRFAGLTGERARMAEVVRQIREIRTTLTDLTANARSREQRADLLRFQVGEIAGAALRVGEDSELLAERSVLANAERLTLDAAQAYDVLAGESETEPALPALQAIRVAAQRLDDMAAMDATARPLAGRLNEIGFLLEDVAAEVRDYRDAVEADPVRLASVEERLDELKRLKRKYGATIEDVIAFGEAAARELENLAGEGMSLDALHAREAGLLTEAGAIAGDLSRRRAEAGERLAAAVERVIAELNMGRSRFAVQITQVDDETGVPTRTTEGAERRVAFDATGVDRVEFLLAPNAGEALKPLARVASGGETARLMLALKSILSAADETPTLVFDEVDVGVGGRSGQVVGEKLWSLSADHQVIVITHLAQIAAFAETHFRIAKSDRGGRIVSGVTEIAGRERVDELAAMLDGVPVTAASRANAREMLERVQAWKARARSGAV